MTRAEREEREYLPSASALMDALLEERDTGRQVAIAGERAVSHRRRLAISVVPAGLAGAGKATAAFYDSDAALTRKILRELQGAGQIGRIAAELFRAQKASTRAKRYRGTAADSGRSYRDLAYSRKGESLSSLCEALTDDSAGWRWGWGRDDATGKVAYVLYVDLPVGQVSFHSVERFDGPDYLGQWDGATGASERRILDLCDELLG